MAVLVDEMQEATNIDLAQRVKDRMVDWLAALGIVERPARAFAVALNLEVAILNGWRLAASR